MKTIKFLTLAGAVALVAALGVSSAQAGFGRQYYGGWHHGSQGYWYCTHYYKPYADYPTYCYNYAIWYPATPRFAYYYNPYKGTYWGRFDFQTKGYSLLAEKDRGRRLKDIPAKAFPEEGPLPAVPDGKDKVQLEEPPDLPGGENLATTSTGTAVPTPDAVTPIDPKKDEPKKEEPKKEEPKKEDPTIPDELDKTPPPDPVPPVQTGTGVTPPPEPVNPPRTGGATTPNSGGPAVPDGDAPVADALGGGGPKVDPFTPCRHHTFGGCHRN